MITTRDFPGSPVAKTAFQRRGCGFNLIGELRSYVSWPKSQNIKLKQYNKFNKDLKNGPHPKKKKKKRTQKNVTSTGGYHTSHEKL